MRFIALISLCAIIFGSANGQGKIRKYSAELTRPANTTAYTAGDYVSNASDSLPRLIGSNLLEFKDGKIVSMKLSSSGANTTNGNFRVFLFSDSTGLGLLADNAANPLSMADDSLMIGYSDFVFETTGSASGGVAFDMNNNLDIPFQMNVRSGQLKGMWAVVIALLLLALPRMLLPLCFELH